MQHEASAGTLAPCLTRNLRQQTPGCFHCTNALPYKVGRWFSGLDSNGRLSNFREAAFLFDRVGYLALITSKLHIDTGVNMAERAGWPRPKIGKP